MAAPPGATEASSPRGAGEDAKEGVEVCLFDESADGFSRTVRAISELTAGEPELDFPEAEVERIASSVTFLREWRHFSYDPKGVRFTDDTESASSRNDMHNITLPQFSSASLPQISQQEDRKDNTASFDFILFAGGNVWALDWCPRLSDKPGSSINCEYLAVAAHPPGSSYHKLGIPLTGRGIIQVWCLLSPFEDTHSFQSACNKSSGRGRPRKLPDGINSVGSSSNPPKPIGRPRKRPIDLSEPVPKRPRGRPRKYPPPVAKLEDSSLNSSSQDIVLFNPLTTSTVNPDDLPLACIMPTAKSVKSTPGRGRGRPRKNLIDKVTGSSGTVLQEDVCTAPSPTIAACTEPKRKRGRPRKYPVPSNNGSVSADAIEAGKDTTCQPVDPIACTVSDANLSIVAIDATLPIASSPTATCENMSKGQRGRRKKKKEPISSSLSCSMVSGVESQSKSPRETGKDTTCQPVDPIACTMSDTNLSIVAIDAILPITSSSIASCENMSKGEMGRRKKKKEPTSNSLSCSVVSGVESQTKSPRETISDDLTASFENALPSGQSNIVPVTSDLCSNVLSCEGNVHKGILADDSVLPNQISSGKRGRGRPRKNPISAATSFSVVSGTNSPKTASAQTISDNHTDLDESHGKVRASNLGSTSSCGCNTEKCSVHLSDVSPDVVSPAHGFNAEFKEESRSRSGGARKKHVTTEHGSSIHLNDGEPRTLTAPKSNDHATLVENCVEGSRLRKGIIRQYKRRSALNENSSTSIGSEAHTVERSTASISMQTSRSDNMADEAGLIGFKNGIVGRKDMKVNENNTGNELVPVEESREDDNKLSSMENSNPSPVPKDIALPRVVLCLAHNGKVAWDIKWRPLIPNQPEKKSCLGFLAVLLGNGSIEVWEVPSPLMIQKIYSPSKVEGSDPRFLKLQPVFRCAKVTCGNRQSIPLTVDWTPSPPHDMILAGCHDGTVALWKFSANFSLQDSKPFMCVTADSVPIRALSWAPYISDENINTFVTAGEDGLKFWDLRDPYRPLWELTTAPRAVLSLHWLKDARGIIISLEDGTLKFLSLPRIANDVPVTGKPFVGTKTQGVSTYQLSEYLIWSVHASEITGYAAYCGADGTAVHFQLTSRFWEKEPGRNRAPYFLCGSLSEEGENIKIGSTSRKSPLSNVPLGAKKGPKSCQDVVQLQDVEKEKLQNVTESGDFLPLAASCVNPELGNGQEDGHNEEQGMGAIVLAGPTEQEDDAIWNSKAGESPKDFEVFPPKSVALHRVRWNTNKGSERWLCYGGAAGIIRCQRI